MPKSLVHLSLQCRLTFGCSHPEEVAETIQKKPNVLFIAIEDFRPGR